jgi:hypothetical protein
MTWKMPHGGVRQHALDVVLGQPDRRRHQRGRGADHRHDLHRQRRQLEQDVAPGEQVDAGRDHGRGVDQRRHRGRALHRVREPGEERDLRALAGGAEEQQQARHRDRGAAGGEHVRCRREHPIELERAGGGDQHERAEHEAEVADAVDDERLLPRLRRGRTLVPEADQQVRAQAHALPAHEQEQEVVREHEREHREHEQVQVEEEPPERGVVAHVADGVDVDQRADAGDDQHHDRGQRIEQERDVGRERPHPHPRPRHLGQGALVLGEPGQLEHGAEREAERGDDRAAREPRGAALPEPVAEQQVQRHRGERQPGNPGEERRVHAVIP